MKPVDFLAAARRDYDESFNWYASRSLQAAANFELAVEEGLRQIAKHPMRFALAGKSHRGCPLRRFPFRLIYRVEAHRVLIVAVAHAKRRPNFWANRT